jgi:Queuosine salvage protein
MTQVSLPDRVRAACAWVAARSRWVRIDEGRIPAYAETLPAAPGETERDPLPEVGRGPAVAFAICLNAINFGSGWWPTISKRPGCSGYGTIAAGVRERFAAAGPWSAAELRAMDAATIAAVVGQDPQHPLMPQFARALRDVGAHLGSEHGGSFLALVESASDAPALAGLLADWQAFADASTYKGREVPFFKRAQLAAADVARAAAAELPGVDRLTAFADNLVPHVLRVDGVLRLDPRLTARIEAGELLEHGSPEEVELRACAVHAVELLCGSADSLAPAEADALLWNRGGARRYKSRPRPRSRNTAY